MKEDRTADLERRIVLAGIGDIRGAPIRNEFAQLHVPAQKQVIKQIDLEIDLGNRSRLYFVVRIALLLQSIGALPHRFGARELLLLEAAGITFSAEERVVLRRMHQFKRIRRSGWKPSDQDNDKTDRKLFSQLGAPRAKLGLGFDPVGNRLHIGDLPKLHDFIDDMEGPYERAFWHARVEVLDENAGRSEGFQFVRFKHVSVGKHRLYGDELMPLRYKPPEGEDGKLFPHSRTIQSARRVAKMLQANPRRPPNQDWLAFLQDPEHADYFLWLDPKNPLEQDSCLESTHINGLSLLGRRLRPEYYAEHRLGPNAFRHGAMLRKLTEVPRRLGQRTVGHTPGTPQSTEYVHHDNDELRRECDRMGFPVVEQPRCQCGLFVAATNLPCPRCDHHVPRTTAAAKRKTDANNLLNDLDGGDA